MTTEATEQKDFVTWFRAKYPAHAKSLRVSQSGAHRGKGKMAAIRIAKAKGQGEVKGEADIVILLSKGGFGSLVIEHKGSQQSHKLSDDQIEYLDYHNRVGNMAISTRGADALKAAVDTFMGM